MEKERKRFQVFVANTFAPDMSGLSPEKSYAGR